MRLHNNHVRTFLLNILLTFSVVHIYAQSIDLSRSSFKKIGVEVSPANQLKGKTAVHVIEYNKPANTYSLAVLNDIEFCNGIIEIEVSGEVKPGGDTSLRGFIGLAFRVSQTDSLRFECFYLRPTNGRAEDQLRRNHSTQYISEPGYPWQKLRRETPGLYESYADIVPGEWIKLKIEVKDNYARLYVRDAKQPVLIVKDIKQGITKGSIGLWIGAGTIGYFRNLKITHS